MLTLSIAASACARDPNPSPAPASAPASVTTPAFDALPRDAGAPIIGDLGDRLTSPVTVHSEEDAGPDLQIEILFAGLATQPFEGHEDAVFEVIEDDDRFVDVISSLGSSDVGGPSAPGNTWHPDVDFDHDVVLWVYTGDHGISRIHTLSATQTAAGVHLQLTVGSTSCVQIPAAGYPYAFLEAPQVGQPYTLEIQPLVCDQDPAYAY